MRTLSHYRIEEEIGRGGMGVVYRAIDTRLERPVAIKMLAADATADVDRHRRFVQEARSASALNHPGIVTIYDIDEQDGTTFIAMELVDGTPLDRLLARGPLPVDQALDYAVQMASGLEVAHRAGIVHRDLKPANIMVTRDRRAKILDFGLAKLLERGPDEATLTVLGTRSGVIMGTAGYMSPEQAQGRPVTVRSDVFSFGAVLYELFAGCRPFTGDSELALLSAILRDEPPPLQRVRPGIPAQIGALVERCLAKDPGVRFANAGEVRAALVAAATALHPPAIATGWRRGALLSAAALVVAVAAFSLWQAIQAHRAQQVRLESIQQIERLVLDQQAVHAIRLAREAERVAPEAVARLRDSWFRFSFSTDPPGAEVSIRAYVDLDGPWETLGETPISDYLLPAGYYRVHLRKDGYLPVETTAALGARPVIRLVPVEGAPPSMVFVPGGIYRIGVAQPVQLPDFWIDKYEVTNREFKRFVDAGGYRDPRYWREPFRDGTRLLQFHEAMARFRDATGRPGPATWELETYPAGQEEVPVGGLSWFEAAAYAEFAGKALPTLHHWYRAASTETLYSDILRLSNFDGAGPSKAGARSGLSPVGTYDMAGNVKEWVSNSVTGRPLRYILGGAWNEPAYQFAEPDAQDAWQRAPTFGVRLVKNLAPMEPAALEPIARVAGDPKGVVPVSAQELEYYKRFYQYDRTALHERVDGIDDASEDWRKEAVSFDAAYGGDRIPAYLFLPRKGTPPFQTVVLFPSAYAINRPTSAHLDLRQFDFIIRSGRALLYPVYQGTFERRRDVQGPSAFRDLTVQQVKDFFRAVDYLATRPDVDMEKLGYYSVSMGAYLAPVPLSLEPRIKAAVLVSGGLRYTWSPEIQPANFAPGVSIPVLLVNGRDDFGAPAAARERFIELLGTPAAHKRIEVLEGGHFPHDLRGLMRHTLDWFDKYLGAVR
jgi:dienelactone hydrolase/predicted Ser/Thr protein kinase